MKVLPLLLVALCAACAQPAETATDRTNHVERVLQDVTAMLEGMAAAHTGDRVVLRGPEYRSSAPHAPE